MSAVVQVFFCKVIPVLRTPERVEPATKAVQGVLQVMFITSESAENSLCTLVC